MKDLEAQSRFVELRALGRSYTDIAAELRVSKTTLVAWSRKHRIEISNLSAIARESLQKRLKVDCDARLEAHATLLSRLLEEAARRNLESLQTEKLIELILKTSNNIANQTTLTQFRADSPLFEMDNEVEWAG